MDGPNSILSSTRRNALVGVSFGTGSRRITGALGSKSPDAKNHKRPQPKTRILFISEVATLAHFGRPHALAQTLDPDRYEIQFACPARFNALLTDRTWKLFNITSQDPEQFLEKLARGAPLWTYKLLREQIEEDLTLLCHARPEIVVGDLRLSLSISARLLGIPYINITNSYWSPFAERSFPLPEYPLVRILGRRACRPLFNLLRPLFFKLHARPFNRLKKMYGMDSRTQDASLLEHYTDADWTLYADLPELTRMRIMPVRHSFIGPLQWSYPAALPVWWPEFTNDGVKRPRFFLTLGSSGQTAILPRAIAALAASGAKIAVATAGRAQIQPIRGSIYVTNYLPAAEACRACDIVVCNGGSPMAYAALNAGKPVLGIPSNMDQHLMMQSVSVADAGILVRSEEAAEGAIQSAARRLLFCAKFKSTAQRMSQSIARWDTLSVFESLLAEVRRAARAAQA
jgi:UDP:flavonoid glycosyltransferase YjiC (YdhE family)